MWLILKIHKIEAEYLYMLPNKANYKQWANTLTLYACHFANKITSPIYADTYLHKSAKSMQIALMNMLMKEYYQNTDEHVLQVLQFNTSAEFQAITKRQWSTIEIRFETVLYHTNDGYRKKKISVWGSQRH